MNSFIDYYAVLGVEKNATQSDIKAAFKKLALQYHPDVNKGTDAEERMRLLLLAYKTLNNAEARRQYDVQRSEYIQDSSGVEARNTGGRSPRTRSEVSPGARRDRKRRYDFPELRGGQGIQIDLIEIAYALSAHEVRTFAEQGMLRGIAPGTDLNAYYCHRCHHKWSINRSQLLRGKIALPGFCPKCLALDWSEYLLLRCAHCKAVFESEQIRYEIGTYTYGKKRQIEAPLCPPYELFPLCPYCGRARWCPVEEARVEKLRTRVARKEAVTRIVVIGVVAVVIAIIGVLALLMIR